MGILIDSLFYNADGNNRNSVNRCSEAKKVADEEKERKRDNQDST